MKKSLVMAALTTALAVGSVPVYATAQPTLTATRIGLLSFLFGGRQYCWYDAGWQGPGWYWCGYQSRRGLGWGGGDGWNGHRGGGGRGGGYRVGQAGHGRVSGGHTAGGHVSSGHTDGHTDGGHTSEGHSGGGDKDHH